MKIGWNKNQLKIDNRDKNVSFDKSGQIKPVYVCLLEKKREKRKEREKEEERGRKKGRTKRKRDNFWKPSFRGVDGRVTL